MNYLSVSQLYDSLSNKEKNLLFEISKKLNIKQNVLINFIDKLDYLNSAQITKDDIAELNFMEIIFNYQKIQYYLKNKKTI